MNKLKIHQLDFRYLLIENYKELGLNEEELVVLLLIYDAELEEPSLITAEQLILKMSLKEKEINDILVNLISKKFLAYESVGNILVTSLKPTKEKIMNWFRKEIFSSSEESVLALNDEANGEVFLAFEDRLQRPLSSFEIDAIHSWFSDGIKKEMILDTLNECYKKKNRVSVKEVDKMLLKKLEEKDINNEGYSAINDKNRNSIENNIKNFSSELENKNDKKD